MRHLMMIAALAAFTSAPAFAESAEPSLFPPRPDVWQRITFDAADAPTVAPAHAAPLAGFAAATGAPRVALDAGQTSPPPKLAAVEYSDAYKTRAKIHKYSSFAMLPLVGTELLLGNSLYNTPSDSKKTAHIVVGTAIMGLFGVNTVTGVWNMWEGRNDSNGRTRRMVHGILMLASDALFVATAASGPGRERQYEDAFTGGNSRGTHRAIAISAISTATAGYLIMLFGGH